MDQVMKKLKFAISLALLGLLGVFALQNSAPVELQFLHWTFESRRAVVIAVSLIVGLTIGWLLGRFRR